MTQFADKQKAGPRASRRTFLKGTGALIITFPLLGSLNLAETAAAAPAGAPLGAPSVIPPATNLVDSYLRIGGDGSVKVFTGKVELGQGNQTALSQIVAEELDVPFSAINMTMGDTALTPDQGGTFGSTTIFGAGPQLRAAAAEARRALLNLASTKLNAPVSALTVSNGVVSVGGDSTKSASYASLIGNQQFNITLTLDKTNTVQSTAPVKAPASYQVVGASVPRVDIAPKMTGQFTYVQDVKVAGMLHGRLVRPPAIGSQVVSINGFKQNIPGAQVVNVGNFVGVVANTEWDAIQASQALDVTWSDWSGLPNQANLQQALRDSPGKDVTPVNTGDVMSTLNSAPTALSATYFTPFEMHGSIGPSAAVADVQPDSVTVWSATQQPHQVRMDMATLLGMKPDAVRIINVEGSGCYGRNGADDAAAAATLMSSQVGKPVRVQFMRQDEHGLESKGPAMVQDMAGALDSQGNLVGWRQEVWTPPHYASTYITGLMANKQVGVPVPGAFNTPPWVYQVPNTTIIQHNQGAFAGVVLTAWLRGPAQFQHTFAMEAFLDEMAAAAGADPVDFRMAYLTEQRIKDVLTAVTQAYGWDSRPSPAPNSASAVEVSGRGVAVSDRGGTLSAEIAEVTVNRSTGVIKVNRFWAAQDCGLIINPAAVKAQIESNIIQATSRTLKEEVTFDNGNITSLDWVAYPILTYPEVPDIQITLVNRPDLPATGVGEPTTCPVAGAISNAVFDATGVRLRTLPFRPATVLAALNA